jgi:ribosomal protein S18 acetylase RimI-like enzyme
MKFVDQAFARRLESAEEMPQVLYGQLYKELRPEIGAAVEPICGGHMIFAGVSSPIGRTVGVGFDGSCSATDLDRMEEFYRAHGAPSQIDVCPLTDTSLLELLKQRGYTFGELNNVLFRPLGDTDDADPAIEGTTLREARSEEAQDLGDILVRGFFPSGDAPPDFSQMVSPLYSFAGALSFVAEVDDQKVACGVGLVIPEYGIAALFGAVTLPDYRRRGLQTALLKVRMAAAVKAGCEYAVIVTNGGSGSQRNVERLGFHVAYSKVTLVKAFESTKG